MIFLINDFLGKIIHSQALDKLNLFPEIDRSPLILEIHSKKRTNSNPNFSPGKKEDDKSYIEYRTALAKMKFRMEMDSNSSGTRRLFLLRQGALKVNIYYFII